MINIAVLGMGRIGSIHAHNVMLCKNANLYAIHDPYNPNINEIAHNLNTQTLSYNTILDDENIDAVLICTPTNQHVQQIEDCIQRGKAVFCEKPIDLDIKKVKQCLDIISYHKGYFMIGFNRRFDPHFMQLKKNIKDGIIGNIELIQIISRDPKPPPISYIKNSGGLFKDMMIHDLDMARFLLNEEDIININALGSVLIDDAIGEAGDIDTAIVQLKSQSGKLISITNSRRTEYGYDQRIEVHGSKGMVKADNSYDHHVTIANHQGMHQSAYQNFFLERYAQAYQNEIVYFIDCINNKIQPKPNGYDGFVSLELAQAALKSYQNQ